MVQPAPQPQRPPIATQPAATNPPTTAWPATPTPVLVPAPAPAPAGQATRPAPTVAPASTPGVIAVAPPAVSAAKSPTITGYNLVAASSETYQQVIKLRNISRRNGIRLEGTLDEASAAFSVRQDDVLVGSRVSLIFSYSPAVAREDTELTVYVNNEPIGTLPLPKGRNEAKTRAEFTFSPALLSVDNRIQFRLMVKGLQNPDVCRLPKERQFWVQIDPESFVYLSAARLPVPDDLASLPRPFADRKDALELSLPFVLPANPAPDVVQAASIVSGYFGIVAQHKGATFPVSFSGLPASNAVVFVLGNNYPAGIPPLPGQGPRIAVITNPLQVDSKLLLMVGANARELQQAAITLAHGTSPLSGPWVNATAATPPPRRPYDAPNWVPSDRPVRLGDLMDARGLSGPALKDAIQVPFRTAPDLFFKNVIGAPFSLRIERAPDSWIESKNSRMYIAFNSARVGEIQMEARLKVLSRLKEWLVPGPTDSRLTNVFLPSYQLFSSNELNMTFDLRAKPDADCYNLDWSEQTGIDPNSYMDFSSAMHFTALPNLALFANSGFPFSKFADLANTAFILPDTISADDAHAVLNMTGHVAHTTGVAPIRHVVATSSRLPGVADRDLVVIGSDATQPLHQKWESAAAIRMQGEALVPIAPMNRVERFIQPRDWREPSEQGTAQAVAKRQAGKAYGYISSYWSPVSPKRLVVAIGGSTGGAVVDVANAFRNIDMNYLIQGDYFFLSEGIAGFYSSGRRQFVGELTFWNKFQWVIGAYGFAAFIATIVGILFIAFSIWRLSLIRGRRRLTVP